MHEVQLPAHRADRYERPADLAEALELLSALGSDGRVLAGGTDLLLEMQRRVRADFTTLVDITGVPGLNTITETEGVVSLGPLVTHAQAVASDVVVRRGLPLAQACWEIGSPQLRNRSTIAGNLVTASPANDTISALWALNATVELSSIRGTREVALRDFYEGVRRTVMQPGELMTRISFPGISSHGDGVFVKLGLRRAQAISVVHAAIVIDRDDNGDVSAAAIALGSVAPTIVSATDAESALVGGPLTEDSIAQAAAAAVASVEPIDDLRATADYRSESIAIVVARGLAAIATGEARSQWPDSPVLLGPAGGVLGGGGAVESLTPGDTIAMRVNGDPISGDSRPDETLLDWLRDQGLTGSKEGCAEGECGACTVWLDGAAVMSCLVVAPAAAGSSVITIEGLAPHPDELHPVQHQFIEHGAVQCGFCIPGILMAAARLLEDVESPTRDDVSRALSGNLCRCTGYYKIIDAVMDAAGADR
ncbi:MAG: 2Fe-2S iron-sulfur cluster binding domain-containing protein [Acidimicrobiia bacterium]|nr:2Fe-2S iron-sulfur cluster binding domain-containing protein [Acidimicrobiia bacterium]